MSAYAPDLGLPQFYTRTHRPDWRVTGTAAPGRCSHCGRTFRTRYAVAARSGAVIAAGFSCLRQLTGRPGLTLPGVRAEISAAQGETRWAEWAAEHERLARMITWAAAREAREAADPGNPRPFNIGARVARRAVAAQQPGWQVILAEYAADAAGGVMVTLGLPQFYTGTHRPGWLWDGTVDFPLMVSDRALRHVAAPQPATVPEWALDSGGFTELARFGRWTVTPREYAERVARYDREVGGLAWAATQDWMCEPAIIAGGRVSATVTAPGTGLSVAEHQRRTVANYLELTALWPQYSDAESPFIVPLQGYTPQEYEDCYELLLAAGIDPGRVPLVGVGSVCRRQSEAEIADVVSVVGQLPMVTHWFGMKLTGIRRAGVRARRVLEHGDWTDDGPASMDSMAWSYDARRGERLPGCTHEAEKCSGCRAYAAMWRGKAVAALRDARDEPAWVQDGLLTAEAASRPPKAAAPAARTAAPRPAAWAQDMLTAA